MSREIKSKRKTLLGCEQAETTEKAESIEREKDEGEKNPYVNMIEAADMGPPRISIEAPQDISINGEQNSPSGNTEQFNCYTGCQPLKAELNELRAKLEDIEREFKIPAPSRQPSGSEDQHQHQRNEHLAATQPEVDRLRRENSALIATVGMLNKLHDNPHATDDRAEINRLTN